MFRTNESARLRVPSELSSLSHQEAVYRHVEIIGELPIWLLRLELDEGGEGRWWKQILVADIGQACSILDLDFWLTRSLYVLLPAHLASSGAPRLSRCLAVHQCLEAHSSDLCWRITTSTGTVLHSFFGTSLGNERREKLLWADEGSDKRS